MSNTVDSNGANAARDEQILFRQEVESFKSRVGNLTMWCGQLRRLGVRENLSELLAIESVGGELLTLVTSVLTRLSALTAQEALMHEPLQSFSNDCRAASKLLRGIRPASQTCLGRTFAFPTDILPFDEEEDPAVKQSMMDVFGSATWLDASTAALNQYAYMQGTVVYNAGLSVLRMMEVSICDTFGRAFNGSGQRASA